jgi:hypothetical protein
LKDVVTKHREEAKVYSVEVCPKAWRISWLDGVQKHINCQCL